MLAAGHALLAYHPYDGDGLVIQAARQASRPRLDSQIPHANVAGIRQPGSDTCVVGHKPRYSAIVIGIWSETDAAGFVDDGALRRQRSRALDRLEAELPGRFRPAPRCSCHSRRMHILLRRPAAAVWRPSTLGRFPTSASWRSESSGAAPAGRLRHYDRPPAIAFLRARPECAPARHP